MFNSFPPSLPPHLATTSWLLEGKMAIALREVAVSAQLPPHRSCPWKASSAWPATSHQPQEDSMGSLQTQWAEWPLCVHSWVLPSAPPLVPWALPLFLKAQCPPLGFCPHGSYTVTTPSKDSLRPAPFRVLCIFRGWRWRQAHRMPLGLRLRMR